MKKLDRLLEALASYNGSGLRKELCPGIPQPGVEKKTHGSLNSRVKKKKIERSVAHMACLQAGRGDLKYFFVFVFRGHPGFRLCVIQGKVRLFRPQIRLGTVPSSSQSREPFVPLPIPRETAETLWPLCIICISLSP